MRDSLNLSTIENSYERLYNLKDTKFSPVANYILSFDEYEDLTTKGIQNECHVSASSITNFVQRIDYSHFYDLKYSLIYEEKIADFSEDNKIFTTFFDKAEKEKIIQLIRDCKKVDHIIISTSSDYINYASLIYINLFNILDKEIIFATRKEMLTKVVRQKDYNSFIIHFGDLNSQFEILIDQAILNNKPLKIYNLGTSEHLKFQPKNSLIDYLIIEEKPTNKVICPLNMNVRFYFLCGLLIGYLNQLDLENNCPV